VLREIGFGAFWWNGLKRIVIPASVRFIGEGAFPKCSSVASVTFESRWVLREILRSGDRGLRRAD
jgi:hypothetical protein